MKDQQLRPIARSAAILMVLGAVIMAPCTLRLQAQNRPSEPARIVMMPPLDPQAEAGKMENTRQNFLQLLRFHPRLVDVIYHDPSLLTDADYVKKSAPEVWAFLEQHPEVAQDPEYFLGNDAARMHDEDDSKRRRDPDQSVAFRFLDDIGPFLVFLTILAAMLWVFRTLLENRRWSRIAKTQTEAHTKLLEKFASNQELAAYMQTEAGRRFLESAPIPVDIEPRGRISAPLGRILWSAQAGVILAMAGIGLLVVRSRVPGSEQPLLVFGALTLMLGVGFVLSAGVSYLMSRRLGLLDRDAMGPAA